ncbi:MAG TPA: flagellar hook capping FlgD N-terminal domain-containing protein [Longimicrobiales bacterium]|nr:flagellar hook capping FlgD N-terminal domain-containing protein [Longimicrobiales bacterium]
MSTTPIWGSPWAQTTGTGTDTAAAAPAPPGGKLGKDQFLQLLVAQMRSQDPMDPSKPDEFAAQLAQFSSLEQLVQLGDQIKAQTDATTTQTQLLQALAGGMNSSAAVSALGRTVVTQGNEIAVGSGSAPTVAFDLAADAAAGQLHVFDAAGHEVLTQSLSASAAGRQTLALDPAATLPPGKYTYVVEAADAAGKAVDVTPYSVARVDGVRYGTDGPVLLAGPMEIPMSAVVQIAN